VTSLILTISRSYSNYQFAKFCWKSVVQPQLHANGDGISENTITCWLLDNDPQSRVNAGVFDRLLRHVDRISKDTKEAQQKGNKQMDTRYDIRLAIDVDRVILCLTLCFISTSITGKQKATESMEFTFELLSVFIISTQDMTKWNL